MGKATASLSKGRWLGRDSAPPRSTSPARQPGARLFPPLFWGKRLNKQILPNCGEGEAKAAGTLLPGSFVPLGVTQEKPRLLHALVRRFGGERERERERSAPWGCWRWAEVPASTCLGAASLLQCYQQPHEQEWALPRRVPPIPIPTKATGIPWAQRCEGHQLPATR